MISNTIEPSPLDPLVILPIPDKLPDSPIEELDPLMAAIESQLIGEPSVKIPIITARMRQIHRNSQVLLNAARHKATKARSKLDSVDVNLRGVEYERERVREEIDRCADYKPHYESLELQNELPSGDYNAIIARLEKELVEIIEREERVAELRKERNALIKAKREIKAKSDAVDVYLADFAKTTNAVAAKIKDIGASKA